MRISVTLLLGVLALAACGGDAGGPSIDRPVAAKLARAADAVASAPEPCSARDRAVILQRRTIAAINAGHIPDAYLEPMQARVNEIARELQVRCLPQPSPQAQRAAVTPVPREHSAPKGKKHRGRGRGKHDD